MTKVSIRKFSILGLVLMAASAITAAFVPAKKDARETGVLVATNTPRVSGQLTCVAGTGSPACNITASSTTELGDSSAVQNSSNGAHSSGSPV